MNVSLHCYDVHTDTKHVKHMIGITAVSFAEGVYTIASQQGIETLACPVPVAFYITEGVNQSANKET